MDDASARMENKWFSQIKHTLHFDKLSPLVRKIIVAIIGGVVIMAGVVMIFFPGPAFLVIPLGFAILASEFGWAKRGWEKFSAWLKKVRNKSKKAWAAVRKKIKKVTAHG